MENGERERLLNSIEQDVHLAKMELSVYGFGNPYHAETFLKRAKANIEEILKTLEE